MNSGLMRESVNAAIFYGRRLLLVQKKDSWLLPGGKRNDPEEIDLDCLCREIREELSGTELKDIKPYREFIGKTHIGEDFKTIMYFATIDGELGEPSAEIKKRRWVSDFTKYGLSDMNSKVINALKEDKYLIE